MPQKLASRACLPLAATGRPNQHLSMDFIHERTEDSRKFRVLSIIDEFTRVCVALIANHQMTGVKVVTPLEKMLQGGRPAPESITTHNGSEFVGKALDAWAMQRRVKLNFIQPGKPVKNGYVESLHGRLRDECLNAEIFFSLADAQNKLHVWRDDYNHQRRHSALADARRFPSLSDFNHPLNLTGRRSVVGLPTALRPTIGRVVVCPI